MYVHLRTQWGQGVYNTFLIDVLDTKFSFFCDHTTVHVHRYIHMLHSCTCANCESGNLYMYIHIYAHTYMYIYMYTFHLFHAQGTNTCINTTFYIHVVNYYHIVHIHILSPCLTVCMFLIKPAHWWTLYCASNILAQYTRRYMYMFMYLHVLYMQTHVQTKFLHRLWIRWKRQTCKHV